MRTVLRSWGPGKFDAELFLDGKAFRPDGKIRRDADPAGVRPRRRQPAHLHRLGLGDRTGTRSSPTSRCTARARSTTRGSTTRASSRSPPRNGFGNVRNDARPHHRASWRRCTSTSSRSRRRSRRRAASTPRRGSAGEALFNGQGRLRALPRAAALHRAGLEHAHRRRRSASTTSRRSARPTSATARRRSRAVRRTRRAASTTTAASPTLRDVVDHYDAFLHLGLSAADKADLAEYLKSI